jgi:hypothetical protein
LNEEKLCQVLANQTRALQKKRSQGVSHAHHLPIKPLQSQASLRVPETVAQGQTSSQRKTAAVVVQNSALQTPMPHALYALHAQRVHSLRLVLQKLMVTQVAHLTETAMTARLAKTAADALHTATAMTALRKAVTTGFQVMSVATLKTAAVTRVVQSVQAMATAMTVVLVAETAQLTAVQVQLPVAATVAK